MIVAYRITNRKEFRIRNDFEKFFQNLFLRKEPFMVNLQGNKVALMLMNISRTFWGNEVGFSTISTYNDHMPKVTALNIRYIKCWAIVILLCIFICDGNFKIRCWHFESLHFNWKMKMAKNSFHFLSYTKSTHIALTMWLSVKFAAGVVVHFDCQRWC